MAIEQIYNSIDQINDYLSCREVVILPKPDEKEKENENKPTVSSSELEIKSEIFHVKPKREKEK